MDEIVINKVIVNYKELVVLIFEEIDNFLIELDWFIFMWGLSIFVLLNMFLVNLFLYVCICNSLDWIYYIVKGKIVMFFNNIWKKM